MDSGRVKVIFFGTPGFARVILKKLIEAEYDISAVFTQPDRKVGRKQKVVFSPVKILALNKDLKIYQPDNLISPEVIENIEKLNPDLVIVAAYGKMLPKGILDIPRCGCINIHASLLPKWRGASPIQNSILAGEKETGVTLIRMNEKMDEGEMIAWRKTIIKKTENTEALSGRLADIGSELLIEKIPLWILGKIKTEQQDGKLATYCQPIKKEDGRIDWSHSAEKILRRFLAFQPWPGIWTEIKAKNGSKRLKLVEIIVDLQEDGGEDVGKVVKYNQRAAVQTGKGKIVLEKVQLEGKNISEIKDFLRGNKNFIGSRLG
jgi:methionyl-tRNA formyltransferase